MTYLIPIKLEHAEAITASNALSMHFAGNAEHNRMIAAFNRLDPGQQRLIEAQAAHLREGGKLEDAPLANAPQATRDALLADMKRAGIGLDARTLRIIDEYALRGSAAMAGARLPIAAIGMRRDAKIPAMLIL